MMKRIVRRNKRTDLTLIVRCRSEKEAKTIRKGFQKMIRECDHLLESKMGYEIIITGCYDKSTHQEEKQNQ